MDRRCLLLADKPHKAPLNIVLLNVHIIRAVIVVADFFVKAKRTWNVACPSTVVATEYIMRRSEVRLEKVSPLWNGSMVCSTTCVRHDAFWEKDESKNTLTLQNDWQSSQTVAKCLKSQFSMLHFVTEDIVF